VSTVPNEVVMQQRREQKNQCKEKVDIPVVFCGASFVSH
jgi:hypothetical protein